MTVKAGDKYVKLTQLEHILKRPDTVSIFSCSTAYFFEQTRLRLSSSLF